MNILDKMAQIEVSDLNQLALQVDVSDIGERYRRAPNCLELLRVVGQLCSPTTENVAKLWALYTFGYAPHLFKHQEILGILWGECGFPHIKIDDSLAASFMFSDVDSSFASEVVHPWTCYAISVPQLFGPKSPTHILVTDLPKHWTKSPNERVFRITACYSDTSNRGFFTSFFGTITSLLREDGEFVHEGKRFSSFASDKQVVRLLINLIVGVCIEMSRNENRSAVECIGSMRNSVIPAQYRKDVPFVLGRPVKVDVRDAVRAYVEGKETSGHGVRTLVRGHHKRQPCGFKSMERKWIHVEPYWRGPEDAPVVVRPHILGASRDEIVCEA